MPVITNVSVNITDLSVGENFVMWSKPSELDTLQYPGPYHYKVYSGSSPNNIVNFIGQTSPSSFLALADTSILDNNVNTSSSANFYRVELFYTNNFSDSLVGTSNSAGSIFVTAAPNDNKAVSYTHLTLPTKA